MNKIYIMAENIGATLGGATGGIIGMITFSGVLESALYAAIGGIVGYISTRVCKYLLIKLNWWWFKKYRNKGTEKYLKNADRK